MKLITKVFIFLQFTNYIVAQDVQFSQLFADRMYLNPAYAGSDYCGRITLNHRNQWSGVHHPYSTFSASFDKYSPIIKGGYGIRFMNDKQGGGVFTQTSADLIYSFHTKLSRKISVKFAMQASLVQKSINPKDLVFPNMINPQTGIVYSNVESFDNENFASPDFGVGMLISYKNYFFGIAANHIPQSLVEEHNKYLPVKYLVHTGGLLTFDKNDRKQSTFAIEPNLVYINQQDINMLYYGMYFDVKNIAFGMFYRQNLNIHFDAMVLSLHLNVNRFAISYSYDVTLSSFLSQTLGSHEISLGYLFYCEKKIKRYNTITCPSL